MCHFVRIIIVLGNVLAGMASRRHFMNLLDASLRRESRSTPPSSRATADRSG